MIFVKFPEPGKVKTRLAASLGDEAAAKIYRKLVSGVAENVAGLGSSSTGNDIWIVFDPSEREEEVRLWLDPLFGDSVSQYLAQLTGDLGDRLAGAFAAGFDAGFEKVAAIGTDCVDLDREGIAACWRHLEEVDVVFGPAVDGGYYLIGLKKMCPELFVGIPWSSALTLKASQGAAARNGLEVGELGVLSDIDECDQWQALCASDSSWEL